MVFQAVPDCAGVEVRFTLPDNAPAEWNMNFHYTLGAYDQAALNTLTTRVDQWAGNDVRPALSNAILYRETYARGLSLEFDVESLDATGTGIGGQVTVPLPNECALKLKFGTSLTGRSARGGVFLLPPSPGQMLTPNVVTSGYRNAFITLFEDLFADTAVEGWQAVVVQRFEDNVRLLPNAFLRSITTVSAVDDILDSQRGRKPKP